ncbi:hypothetical protein NQZ68_000364 [Dissostichus eleginoides]|nr:hypothetical protein NQZ68_000364 [Dissostichus eleginoides]
MQQTTLPRQTRNSQPLGGRYSLCLPLIFLPPLPPLCCRQPASVIHQLKTQAEISRGTVQLAEE